MTEPYEPRFPRLFDQWRGHDLAVHRDPGGPRSIRPSFYEGLRQEDEPSVWRFIEENYLLRYERFMAVRFDWSSSGLWRIPFPGSVADTYNVGLDGWGVPERVRTSLGAWHDELDHLDRLEEDWVDHDASRAKGLATAKEVKLFLGDDYYVEFELFREIVVVGGAPTELDVPEFIRTLTR